MTDRLDRFAEELLQKTASGKLSWRLLETVGRSHGEMDGYCVDLGDQFQFVLRRFRSRDNIRITFHLVSLSDAYATRTEVRNYPLILSDTENQDKVHRFRLYSDLFHAARESSIDRNQEFDKVEELLRKIG